MENQSIVFPPRLYSICCFSTISLTTTPWLSRQGAFGPDVCTVCHVDMHSPHRYHRIPLKDVNVSNPCSFKKRATSVVSSSCAALVCSISCIFIRSETSCHTGKENSLSKLADSFLAFFQSTHSRRTCPGRSIPFTFLLTDDPYSLLDRQISGIQDTIFKDRILQQ